MGTTTYYMQCGRCGVAGVVIVLRGLNSTMRCRFCGLEGNEATAGNGATLTISKPQACVTCGGQGTVGDGGYVACPACGPQTSEVR